MVSIILTHQDDLPQMLGHHLDLMHESVQRNTLPHKISWGSPYPHTLAHIKSF